MSNAILELVQARLLAAVFSWTSKCGWRSRAAWRWGVRTGLLRYTKDIDLAADLENMLPACVAGVVRSAFKRLQASGALSNVELS